MLSISKYDKSYIDECILEMKTQLAVYKNLIQTVQSQRVGHSAKIDAAIEAFEPVFFNNMVMVIDNYFIHRSRALELKDGNPLNEVRLLCNSLMNHKNRFTAEKAIRYDPAKSVLKYKEGDEIRIKELDFSKLSNAFFREIEKKYS